MVSYNTILITDPCEEIDDECAIKYLSINNIKAAIVCVGGKIPSIERKEKLKTLINNITDVYTFEEFDFERTEWLTMKIIQIGPLDESCLEKVKYIADKCVPYEYTLQGKLGSTVNSKGNSKICAEYFYNNSVHSQIIEAPYPKFTYNNSVYFGSILQNEIIKLGFKNTLGRAPPLVFTAHLIGPNGANYESVKTLYKSITNEDIEVINVSRKSLENAANYLDNIDYEHDFVKSKMTDLNQTKESHLICLSRICAVFEELFNINEIIYSSDDEFDNIDYPNSKFYESYQIYKNLLIQNPNTELTPAYDLKAVDCAVTGITEYKTVEEIMNIENLNKKHIMYYLLFISKIMFLIITYLTVYNYLRNIFKV
jgi:hypothetical protein